MKERIIFINRFYAPETPATAQLLSDLAGALAAGGRRVAVITSLPQDLSLPDINVENGVEVHRVPMSRLGARNLVGRTFDFGTFIRAARRKLGEIVQEGDIVVPMTDPPMLGMLLGPVAFKRKARCIHWVQDIFPEIAVALSTNALAREIGNVSTGFRNRAWEHATAIVAPSRDMADYIIEAAITHNRVAVIPNWAPAGIDAGVDSRKRREAWKLDDKFIIAYSGNLGRVHELGSIPELAGLLSDSPQIAFLFIGGGAGREPLESAVRAAGLTNVHFQPAQPRELLSETLAVGDLHLVTLKGSCSRYVFPSKLYGTTAAGRPVLFIGAVKCEAGRIPVERGFGQAFEPTQMREAAAEIRRLAANPAEMARLGAASRAFHDAEGNLDYAVSRWNQLLAKP